MPVGAPAAPGGASPLQGRAVVPFSEFYAATGGDPTKAEAMVPGITTRQGAKLLQMGQDGKPVVQLKTVQAQAMFDQGYREHQQRIIKLGSNKKLTPEQERERLIDDVAKTDVDPDKELVPIGEQNPPSAHPNLKSVKFKGTNQPPPNKLVVAEDTNEEAGL